MNRLYMSRWRSSWGETCLAPPFVGQQQIEARANQSISNPASRDFRASHVTPLSLPPARHCGGTPPAAGGTAVSTVASALTSHATAAACERHTSRHRWRQTPQRNSRVPSRSICTSMQSSVSSTLVTVWAFKRNCFLIKVSMNTSVPVLASSWVGNTKLTGCRGAVKSSAACNFKHSKGFNCNYTFRRRTI